MKRSPAHQSGWFLVRVLIDLIPARTRADRALRADLADYADDLSEARHAGFIDGLGMAFKTINN